MSDSEEDYKNGKRIVRKNNSTTSQLNTKDIRLLHQKITSLERQYQELYKRLEEAEQTIVKLMVSQYTVLESQNSNISTSSNKN